VEAIRKTNHEIGLTKDQQHILYKTHYKSVYYSALYRVKDRNLAEDLTNDAFLLAFEKIHTLKNKDKFKSWICSIVSNLAKDYFKKYSRISLVDTIDDYTGEALNPEEEVLHKIVRDDIKEAILGLDHDYKNVIVLRYFHDLSYKAIARQLCLNDNTVKTRLRRAKGRLYSHLS